MEAISEPWVLNVNFGTPNARGAASSCLCSLSHALTCRTASIAPTLPLSHSIPLAGIDSFLISTN